MSVKPLQSKAGSARARLRFPEKIEYVISAEAGLDAVEKALQNIQGFREKELHFFKDVVGVLSPREIREVLSNLKLDQMAFSYQAIVRKAGYLTALATFMGFHKNLELVKNYYRLAVLPFLDLKLRDKVENLSEEKPFAWKIQKRLYGRLLHSIEQVVDNLMNLMALGWTFNPGIGEPGMETGFYNRFVFGRRCGFLDLGHFFNCAIVSYLYSPEEAKQRGENMELRQRRLRKKDWLKKLRQFEILSPLTDLFWSFAASADTIEDRSSDWFGIQLGEKMRTHGSNGKIIEYFIARWPGLVKDEILGPEKVSWWRRMIEIIKSLFELLRFRIGTGARFDIASYMKTFFETYDAIDPRNSKDSPPGLLEETLSFYFEKYNSDEWEKYTARQWEVIIPQELWEQVVRDKWTQAGWQNVEPELPIRIQLKSNGEKVAPYFREE
jgi:hypothetical protein